MSQALTAMDRLEAERACERLCRDYAYFADAGRMDDWAALFAEDAELRLFGQTHQGRAAIQASVGAGSAAERTTVHALSNIRIEVESPDAASGGCYITLYMAAKDAAPSGSATPQMVGRYEDVYRRTAEGWRIARRAFKPIIR